MVHFISKSICNEPIMLIDKPAHISSFDVIRILRKHCGVRKMGHAGTLDPLATGLLVVGIGDGTKLLKEMIGLTKVYRAQVLFGVRTETGDLEGDVIEARDVSSLNEVEVRRVALDMQGELVLPVPKYSAVKVGGKPLYSRARKGEDFVPPEKTMNVIDIVINGIFRESEMLVADIEWTVGSGTYIRSLAEELGKRLGVPATLKSLRRTRVGEMRVEDAILIPKELFHLARGINNLKE